MSASHIATLLRSVGAKVLVALGPDPDFAIADRVVELREALPELQVLQVGAGERNGAIDFDTMLSSQPAQLQFTRAINPDDTAAFFHTGGTTGSPKFVRHTHRNEIHASWLMGMAYGFTPDDVVLNGFPLFHVAGAFCHGLAEFAAGASVLIPSKLGMRNATFVKQHWRVVEAHRVTILTGGPTFLTTLLNGRLDGEDISSARVLITGGSPLPPELADAFERRFHVPVRNMFGMTEACGVVSLEPLGAARTPHSCGLPLPFSAVRAIAFAQSGQPDPERTSPPGQTGLLVLRGPAKSARATPIQTGRRRRFCPADGSSPATSATLTRKARVFVPRGARKYVIIRSGHNIDPAVIEEAILRHPAVALCAAVGEPDPYAGELPVAFALLRPGAQCSEGDLMKIAAEHVPERAAAPKRVWIVEAFDMTATGKNPETRTPPDRGRARCDESACSLGVRSGSLSRARRRE